MSLAGVTGFMAVNLIITAVTSGDFDPLIFCMSWLVVLSFWRVSPRWDGGFDHSAT
jgi:hypothetical protein